MPRQRKQRGREHGEDGDHRDATDAEEQGDPLCEDPGNEESRRAQHQKADAAGERGSQGVVHRRVDPADSGRHPAEPSHDERADSSEQTEQLEPVEREGDEVRRRRRSFLRQARGCRSTEPQPGRARRIARIADASHGT